MSRVPVRLVVAEDVEIAVGGTIVYSVLVDGQSIGQVGDERRWRGWRYGGRRWWSVWREPGDTAARWNSWGDGLECRSRAVALAALLAEVDADKEPRCRGVR